MNETKTDRQATERKGRDANIKINKVDRNEDEKNNERRTNKDKRMKTDRK